MATGDYCVIGELKERIWPQGSTPDGLDDNILSSVISAVSRWIDAFTETRFYTTSEDETRYYTANNSEVVFIDDLISLTSLATDPASGRVYTDTWSATDYDLMPYNSTPKRSIEAAPLGGYFFPLSRKGIKVTGTFGYCTKANQPAQVREACLLQCERLFKRKDAPFGMISNPLGGNMSVLKELDPDVKQLLEEYKRYV